MGLAACRGVSCDIAYWSAGLGCRCCIELLYCLNSAATVSRHCGRFVPWPCVGVQVDCRLSIAVTCKTVRTLKNGHAAMYCFHWRSMNILSTHNSTFLCIVHPAVHKFQNSSPASLSSRRCTQSTMQVVMLVMVHLPLQTQLTQARLPVLYLGESKSTRHSCVLVSTTNQPTKTADKFVLAAASATSPSTLLLGVQIPMQAMFTSSSNTYLGQRCHTARLQKGRHRTL